MEQAYVNKKDTGIHAINKSSRNGIVNPRARIAIIRSNHQSTNRPTDRKVNHSLYSL
jgi:hypothetical protein